MALHNMFGEIALESTANSSFIVQVTRDREVLDNILIQLRILNTYMELAHDRKITERDLDKGDS